MSSAPYEGWPFIPLPIRPEIMKKLRPEFTSEYHINDFLLDEDGNWMLKGWKGRIICASSCWVQSIKLFSIKVLKGFEKSIRKTREFAAAPAFFLEIPAYMEIMCVHRHGSLVKI
ncbi:hypothetical protein BUALT_Bualt02G0065400 [Buddleja alternifolia]|uniref:Uncharacterized protein n=1 Tax=Buddleja alternifolia TaxID=168488 RepID=A0AAV6Y8L7_9LAMI|nr:hypothetical protein BUALT_Bualt02G0065400 [Buddleja alternifolia]